MPRGSIKRKEPLNKLIENDVASDIIIKLLYEGIYSEFEVNHHDKDDFCVLIYAMVRDDLELCEALLDVDASAHYLDQEGNNILHSVVHLNLGLEFRDLFIEHGASLHHKNNMGQTPIDLARSEGRISFLEGLDLDHIEADTRSALERQQSLYNITEQDEDSDDESMGVTTIIEPMGVPTVVDEK